MWSPNHENTWFGREAFSADVRFDRGQDSGKQKEGKTFHKLHVPAMNDDFWDRFHGFSSEIWKGCE